MSLKLLKCTYSVFCFSCSLLTKLTRYIFKGGGVKSN